MSDAKDGVPTDKVLGGLKNLGVLTAILGMVAMTVAYFATKGVIEVTMRDAIATAVQVREISAMADGIRPHLEKINEVFGKFSPDDVARILDTISKNENVGQILYKASEPRPPVGSIIAWHKQPNAKHDGSDSGNPLSAEPPDGWMECNGDPLPPNSPLAKTGATHTPKLNSGRFLRGAGTSGTYQSDAFQDHIHIAPSLNGRSVTFWGQHNHPDDPSSNDIFRSVTGTRQFVEIDHTGTSNSGRAADETRPQNMSVVWIIRVK